MRVSSVTFGVAGSCLVLGGVASILIGMPQVSRDLAPVASLSDLASRWVDLSLLLSAALGAVVALVVSLLVALGRLRARVAAVELLVLGVAVGTSLVPGVHRYGYQADGAVLSAAIVSLCGAVAVLVAAFAAAAARD